LIIENKKPLIISHSGYAKGYLSSKGLLGHDEVEVLKADLVSVGGSTLEHFLQFFGAHSLSQLLGDASQIMDADGLWLVIVEQVENTVDALTRLFVSEFVGDSVKEIFKINALRVLVVVQVRNHVVNGRVLLFKSKRLHGSLQFLRVNASTVVSVEQGEGLSDLLNFVFS
jgi:hypothetical protein